MDKKVASKFARRGNPMKQAGVLLRVKSKSGIDISSVSAAAREKEVLVSPSTKWKFQKITKDSITGLPVVHLEEV
ncbi:ADP-ribosyltransferase domain-containing protein [Candidatus Pacearchaeota archaeon]|jgi:hypothetical protein|nr:ADP-ribosyltransferase domain-containing protein [Candidatus Pacearchaeota archaeon]